MLGAACAALRGDEDHAEGEHGESESPGGADARVAPGKPARRGDADEPFAWPICDVGAGCG